MVGYKLEIKRNYPLGMIKEPHTRHHIGQIDRQYVADTPDDIQGDDSTPRGTIELVASQVPPPRISQNFMAPVNEVNQNNICVLICSLIRYSVPRPPTEDARNGQWIMFVASFSLAI